MYVVTVSFRLHPERAEAFLSAIRENAAASLREEPGCHHFDVCTSPDDPTEIFLYELYDDRAAFDAHLASEHFRAFDAMTADWVADKQVHTYLLEETPPRI